jgi:large subunit ribosomal protein L32
VWLIFRREPQLRRRAAVTESDHPSGVPPDERLRIMLPVKKQSRTRTRSRASHHAKTPPNTSRCPKCGAAKLPHAACERCGYVSAKLIIKKETEES